MKLFVYNEHSILNNSFTRTINCLAIGLIIIIGFSNSAKISLSYGMLITICISTALVSSMVIHKVIKATEFYEWDYTERQKKFRFTITYTMVCVCISSLLSTSITIAYTAIKEANMSIGEIIVFLIPVVFFVFNLCNIISLYYPLFSDDLTLGYKIQKKPDNWQDNGREIKNEDEIDEIIHRDFGI